MRQTIGSQVKPKPGKRGEHKVKQTVLTPSLRNSQAFFPLYWEVGSLTSHHHRNPSAATSDHRRIFNKLITRFRFKRYSEKKKIFGT